MYDRGVEYGAKLGSAFGMEAEGCAVIAEILGLGLETVAGVCEFVDAWMDTFYVQED